MFLPVLLVRDYGGVYSFLAFAVPNVVGAAAMGFLLRDQRASREMIRGHTGAMVWFSRVTIAYQAFFAGWMLPGLLGWWTAAMYALLLATLIFVIRRDREFTLTTLGAYLLSLGVAVAMYLKGGLSLPGMGATGPALNLAPVCLLGFLLCPYLDLTFHYAFQRAHQSAGHYGGGAAARWAFAIGFGVIFASMIVLTLLYAQALIHRESRLVGALIGVHMLGQLVVTILLHEHRSAVETRREKSYLLPFLSAFFALGLGCYFTPQVGAYAAGEWVYRAFLAYYALVAPLYVLMRMVTRAGYGLVAATGVVAMPFYALGFFTTTPAWLLAGVAVVLAGWGIAALTSRRIAI
jgi:hypothetical protein